MELGTLSVLHTVFYINVVRSISQVDKIKFDEMGEEDSVHM